MGIKEPIVNLCKKNATFRKLTRKTMNVIEGTKYRIFSNSSVDDKTIIFGSFNGRSYCDSPKAIYEYMVSHKEYEDFKFIWAFKNKKAHEYLEKNRNTEIVEINGKDFFRALGKAKYWFFNYKIADYVYPKKNQVFVQCWHGTPLKRLGCDLTNFDNAMNSVEEIKKRYEIETSKFSYFISPSKFASDRFISIWDLKNNNKENIILEEGYPRNDFLFNYNSEDIYRIKKELGIENSNKKIILYAPTYRDNQHSAKLGYTYKTQVDFDKLKEELQDEYIILFRAHWLVANAFNFEKYKGFIYNVSDYDDINELYVISDMLITDYSSVFFDYANLKRPIIFYMYDLEDYRDNIRGFYLDINELPGNIIKNDNDVIDEIKRQTKNFTYDEKYKAFNQKFNYLDDGKASKRVIEKVII